MRKTKADQPPERYVTLNNIKKNTKVDVYGVVKFFKQPYKSRGSDYCTMISIVDQSYTDPMDKLKCLLFAKELDKLPLVKLGNIVRFHRLSVTEFAGSLQGQSGPGSSWLVFSGDVDSQLEPVKSSSPSFTINDTDRNKVKELRLWANNKDDLHEKLCTFNEIAMGGFFDIVCQVVQTCVVEKDVGRLLKVWDGTRCIYDVREVCVEDGMQQSKDDKLQQDADGFIYDVSLFDNHFMSSSDIKPGDYIKFTNVHAAEHKAGSSSKTGVVEFILHRGDSFNRCVQILQPDNSDLKELKQRQEIIVMEKNFLNSESLTDITNLQDINQPSSCEPVENSNTKHIAVSSEENEVSENVSHKKEYIPDVFPSTSKRPIIEHAEDTSVKQAKKTCGNNVCGKTTEFHVSSSEPRCMAKSSTVVLSHPQIKRSMIKEVLEHSIPYRFKVRVKVLDYHPKADSVKTFLKLYCSDCHYLCSCPGNEDKEESMSVSQLQIGSSFKGVAHYNCPQCCQNKVLQGLDSQPHLQYIYMMRIILSDNTGMLMANIWKEDAVQFFQDMEPEKLLKEQSNLQQVQECLNEICPPNVSVKEKPWIECCIQSYCTQVGSGYQIFDTAVILN